MTFKPVLVPFPRSCRVSLKGSKGTRKKIGNSPFWVEPANLDRKFLNPLDPQNFQKGSGKFLLMQYAFVSHKVRLKKVLTYDSEQDVSERNL